MAIYTWEGKAPSGKALKGEMEAAGVQQVFEALKKQKITPNTQKIKEKGTGLDKEINCLLYTSPSPRDKRQSRMPSSA